MIFSHLVDHDNQYSTKHEEEAKKFFYKYIHEEKQKPICQDFCRTLKNLYINLNLHSENNDNIL